MSHLGSASNRLRNDSEIRRRRLLFRCWHRGTQEIDPILGPFAETYLCGFASAQLDRFEALLDCADADLFDWITRRTTPPPVYDHDVMRLLRSFRNGVANRLSTVRRASSDNETTITCGDARTHRVLQDLTRIY
jgi:antitoxin CptB